MKKLKFTPTFLVGLILCLLLVIWGLTGPVSFEKAATAANTFIGENFSWWYVLIMTSFVLFVIWLGFFSKFKNFRLGDDNEKPEYSYISWFAMLFSAGMGIGLVFWGTAEPLNFFINPIDGIESGSPKAATFALMKAFLHWGLHPWAAFTVTGLALAYFWFRKKTPALISSVFEPLVGEKMVKGWFGTVVDVLAVFAAVAGVSTSFGLGAFQINSGLNMLVGIPENNTVILIIIVIVTMLFLSAAVSGIEKGINFVSKLNVVLCVVIAFVCFIIGPTRDILNSLVEAIGNYLSNLLEQGLSVGAHADGAWYQGWTIFYWAWWIAWAPFTGVFIARISRGRTIKEFCAGVLLVPALVSMIWFAIFGTLGMNCGLDVAREAIVNPSTALFVVLQHYPIGKIISAGICVLLVTFFVTSADAGTFVLGMLTSGGSQNPPAWSKLIWGLIETLIAVALLLFTSNGLNMLQTMSIVGAFPFSFVVVGAVISVVKALKNEKKETN